MNRTIKTLLILSTLFLPIAFLGGEPASARGFYYLIWLYLFALFTRKQSFFENLVNQIPFSDATKFIGLGILMIVIEETIASLAVNILSYPSPLELFNITLQFYANNLLLLPGFIIAWYFLLKKINYTKREVFILVGIFGLFAEKTILHVILIFPFGLALVLPTMFTYMGIIAPSLLSLKQVGTKELSKTLRYALGLLLPILCSVPFLIIHTILVQAGYIDVTVLTK
ncbi:hypothetical protein H6784_03310 [Candidatus Nomurabacteria bacterium]|nr:hypothetical protein [Candidatus Nomurabacteria bacterium]MCB9814421.1 hypothetical protein [Candidatus Nomurabacteria bacterium]